MYINNKDTLVETKERKIKLKTGAGVVSEVFDLLMCFLLRVVEEARIRLQEQLEEIARRRSRGRFGSVLQKSLRVKYWSYVYFFAEEMLSED